MTPDERAAHRAALIAKGHSPEYIAAERREVAAAVLAILDDVERLALGHKDVEALAERHSRRRIRGEVVRLVRERMDVRGLAPALARTTEYLPPPGGAHIGKFCRYCGAPAQAMDHVWPRARGGDNHPNNLVPACQACNLWKSSHSWLTERCPGCDGYRDPSDVNTATGAAYYACRCGVSWSKSWDLQHVTLRRATPSAW
jgi:5-methylcytosine-specific restriction endonuclease McrA